MQLLVVSALAWVVGVVSAADAAQPPLANDAAQKRPDPRFARLDANKDGFLSYQEVRSEPETRRNFALFDENRDGRLSADEFLRLKAAQARNRPGIHIRDGAITSKVKLALLRAKDLKSIDVHVETIAGAVRLSGNVDNAQQAARVVLLAGRVQGVKTVENKLVIRSVRP